MAEARDIRNTEDVMGAAYAAFAPFVSRTLRGYGASEADLPDLCHEVFLILRAKSEVVTDVERLDLWLREVCRRVAASDRRRAYRRAEVLSGDLRTTADASHSNAGHDVALEREETDQQLLSAVRGLDDEARDLLALHGVGDLPITELATLTGRDRKTVRKHLDRARRQVAKALEVERSLATGVARDDGRAALTPRALPNASMRRPSQLEIVAVTEEVRVGLLGNLTITVWPGAVTDRAFDTLMNIGPGIIERCGGRAAYLAIVEPGVRPPLLAARKKIIESLNLLGPSCEGYSSAMLGGMAWIARPIMNGMMSLARPRFPVCFFTDVDSAVRWVCAHFATHEDGTRLSVDEVCLAVEQLRAPPK